MAKRHIFYYKPDGANVNRDLNMVTDYGGYFGWFTGWIDDEQFPELEPEAFVRYKIQEISEEVAKGIVFSQIIPYPETVESGVWRKSIYEGECDHIYDDDGNYQHSIWRATGKQLDFTDPDTGGIAPKYPGKYTLTDDDITNAVKAAALMKTAILKERMEKEYYLLWNQKTPLEKATWSEQSRQATLYRSTGDEADAPLIGQLAIARGRTFSEQLNKVEEKVAEWNAKIAEILGPYQRRIDYIKSATTFEEIYHYENFWATEFNGAAVIATPPSDY
jgi:hypothetical protein